MIQATNADIVAIFSYPPELGRIRVRGQRIGYRR